ncbi:response regulator transcription factor [soil metagenome]
MLTVGVCEDDPAIRRVLSQALRLDGHEPLLAHNGHEALSRFGADSALDVIIMDIGLPDADGRDVCQALKSAGQHAPVLFLTALGDVADRLSGFGAGGEDYVAKPFDVQELLARIAVLGRRGPISVADAGGLVLDPLSHAVRAPGGEAMLTPTEFRMLAAITSRPGEGVRRRTVGAAAWPDGSVVSENTIDSFVRRLRTKLEAIDSPVAIETVRGVGFRLR